LIEPNCRSLNILAFFCRHIFRKFEWYWLQNCQIRELEVWILK
jgi:hypothetical protein